MSRKLIVLTLKADPHDFKLQYFDFSKLLQAAIEMPVAHSETVKLMI